MLLNKEIISSGKWKSQEVFTARLAPKYMYRYVERRFAVT